MSSTNHLGKKVVSANSGNTTNSAFLECASRSSSSKRATTDLRSSERCTGPSWAAATFSKRDTIYLREVRALSAKASYATKYSHRLLDQ